MILTAYIIAVAFDVFTTIVARRHGLREGNPFLRAAGRFWLPIRLAMAALVAVIALTLHLDWPLIVGAVLYGIVAVSNVIVTRGAR